MLLLLGFWSVWLSLIAAPLICLFLMKTRQVQGVPLARVVVLAGSLIVLVPLCWVSGLQWSSTTLNFVSCLSALYAWWILAAAALRIPHIALRIIVGVFCYAPVIPSLLVATIGILGLMFVLGDYLSPAIHDRRLDDQLTCRVTSWGAAFSDSGYTVHLYRSPIWFPIARLEVAETIVNETDPGPGPTSANCEGVAANWRRT
ncbi:hypothetical protein [uncultured Sphingomonas sp.]|uniref:hypothetical protein n=1 Tax=uncultured Sphingomonas sp. TaxID=158754 RepID=UPI00261C687C|nr:hypothetical protein [uncultured Sphingomonas sp.]